MVRQKVAPRAYLQVRVEQLGFAGEMEDDEAAAFVHLIHNDFRPFIQRDDVAGLVKLNRLLVPFAHLSQVVTRLDALYGVGALLAGSSDDWTRERKQTSRCLCRCDGREGE